MENEELKNNTRLSKIPMWSNRYLKKCGDSIELKRVANKYGVTFWGNPEVITLEYHTKTGEIELWYGMSNLGLPNYVNHSEAFKKAKELAEQYNTAIVVEFL